MRESNGKRRRKKPDRNGQDDSLDALLPSYTPKQREKVVNGLRILARVAIRSYMEEEAERSQDSDDAEEDCGEDEVR